MCAIHTDHRTPEVSNSYRPTAHLGSYCVPRLDQFILTSLSMLEEWRRCHAQPAGLIGYMKSVLRVVATVVGYRSGSDTCSRWGDPTWCPPRSLCDYLSPLMCANTTQCCPSLKCRSRLSAGFRARTKVTGVMWVQISSWRKKQEVTEHSRVPRIVLTPTWPPSFLPFNKH